MDKDFNIKVTVRNGRLLNAIRKRYESVADLARQMGRSPNNINPLVTMKVKPINEKGWTDLALDVAAMVGEDPEDLWPKYMREIKLKKATAEVSMDLDSVKQIMADGSSEKSLSQISAIKKLSADLSPREERILQLRWIEDHTLEECGKIFGLSREHIRHIESKAFRKMKHTAKALGFAKKVWRERKSDNGIVIGRWFDNFELKQSGKDLFED